MFSEEEKRSLCLECALYCFEHQVGPEDVESVLVEFIDLYNDARNSFASALEQAH